MSSKPAIPPLVTRGDVADLLEVELRTLTWWVWALPEERRYTEFDIRRRSGGLRRISAPIKPIKDVQRRLASLLLGWYTPPAQVHGFVLGRDPRSNARPHRRQQWVLKADLTDFFPTIHFGRVRGLFMSYPFEFAAAPATLLAQICCYKKRLPQGAPTSPIVSNFICRGMDRQLAELARAERCYFTRYADDLTLSTDRTVFPEDLAVLVKGQAEVGPALASIVTNAGFTINPRKTRLTRDSQRQRVTGLVVNRQLNVPRDYVRGLRNLLHIWRCYGQTAAEDAFWKLTPHANRPPGKAPSPFPEIVRGRVQYVGSVKGWDDPVYTALAASLGALYPAFVHLATPTDSPPAAGTAVADSTPKQPQVVRLYVCTEGATDVTHLRAALAYFQADQQFADLILDFDAHSGFGGDTKLEAHLKQLQIQGPGAATVCLFDRDNDGLIRRQGLTKVDYGDRGNGLVAAALVAPNFRDAPFCIEMLYTDEDLAIKDEHGRRVYLLSEFDTQTRQHKTEQCNMVGQKRDTLVREDVYEFGTKNSLALTKVDFAAAIERRDPRYAEVTFDGFRPTLEMLREAARAVAAKVSPT